MYSLHYVSIVEKDIELARYIPSDIYMLPAINIHFIGIHLSYHHINVPT